MKNRIVRLLTLTTGAICLSPAAWAQLPRDAGGNRGEPPGDVSPRPFAEDGRPRSGPGGRPNRGMPGMEGELKLRDRFDRDGDGRLNQAERQAARTFINTERAEGRGPRRPGFRFRNDNWQPAGPGAQLSPESVPWHPDRPLYDPAILRTLFLRFENEDWEQELADFYRTDVEVPAELTADGEKYPNVGVHFRGASSFFTVPAGGKRSLNLSLDWVDKDQRLYGFRTLHLLNSHTDPTYLRTVLYHEIARQYIPAPKANFVRVVLNGESWGIYINTQPFNKDFLTERFGTDKGARWKVPGSPRGRGGLEYLGEDVAEYRRFYEIKSKDAPQAWRDFIQLCRVLNQKPAEQLEAALAPKLDLDGTLRFLALENVLINADGYWIRSSDYNVYQDPGGRFHLIPHDANETFRPPQGPGSSAGSSGVELDPLTGTEDSGKPLLSKLMAVPSLRARYLGYVRAIAEEWLNWGKLGELAQGYHALIRDDVRTDTHKLDSFEAFTRGLDEPAAGEQPGRGRRASTSLKSFVEQRREYLLNLPEIKQLPR